MTNHHQNTEVALAQEQQPHQQPRTIDQRLSDLQTRIQHEPPTQRIQNAAGLLAELERLENALNQQIEATVSHAEKQLLDRKSKLLSLYEIFHGRELRNTAIVVCDINRANFLDLQNNFPADFDGQRDDPFGQAIKKHHLYTAVNAQTAVYGIFFLLPFGTEKGAKFLCNLTEGMAQNYCMHVFFSPDILQTVANAEQRQTEFGDANAHESPTYFRQLPQSLKILGIDNVKGWVTRYIGQPFYRTLMAGLQNKEKVKRHMTAMFNPVLLEHSLLDRMNNPDFSDGCWGSPVAFIAKLLAEHYETYQHPSELFGTGTMKTLSKYTQQGTLGNNFLPKGPTLWTFDQYDANDLVQRAQLTPLMADAERKQVYIHKAVTLASSYKDLPEATEQERIGKQHQMFRVDLTCNLLEDLICRGAYLVSRLFQGKTEQFIRQNLDKSISDYLSAFTDNPTSQPHGRPQAPPIIKRFEVTNVAVLGSLARVSIRFLPNFVVHDIHLDVQYEPEPTTLSTGADTSEAGRR